eukprot:TRINITY_DN21142_c0_g1_i3.p1 TRINITY_DN21142_c0_g1~~TRINITY_DN21142_c0_g1_i3.p1  ORF type:complete len:270 (+),score=70.63 TRINITY_DN21142_c0_g1_i3:292-1101(+)
MRRVFLIDCPGVVYPSGDDETDIILKGVVRIENLKDPEHHIDRILNRVKQEHIIKTYGITDWIDAEDFLTQLAQKSGRLLKKSEPDLATCAKVVLHDWQGGKLPYYAKPPEPSASKPSKKDKDSEEHVEDVEAAQVEVEDPDWDALNERHEANVIQDPDVLEANEYDQEPAPAEEADEDLDWDDVFDSHMDNKEDGHDDDEVSGEAEEEDTEEEETESVLKSRSTRSANKSKDEAPRSAEDREFDKLEQMKPAKRARRAKPKRSKRVCQ